MFPKPQRIECKPYRDWIRTQPCIVSGRVGCDPHHWNLRGHGGKSSKCSDFRCIPLGHYFHTELHTIGRDSFMAKHGLTDEGIECIIVMLNQKWEKENGTR